MASLGKIAAIFAFLFGIIWLWLPCGFGLLHFNQGQPTHLDGRIDPVGGFYAGARAGHLPNLVLRRQGLYLADCPVPWIDPVLHHHCH